MAEFRARYSGSFGGREAPEGKISVELLRYPLSAKAQRMLQKALQTSEAGDHAGAVNHANLGLALVSNGQYDRAEPELKRALDLDPHYALASLLLGVLALSKNAQK